MRSPTSPSSFLWFPILVAACLSAVDAQVRAQTTPETSEHPLSSRIDELFKDYDRTDSPGCALGVIENGELSYGRGYGMANLEHGVPIGNDTVFRIGSTSKQMAAFAVLLLAEDGKLSLDDDVRKHIPELKTSTPTTTIRHLVHHTSGLRDYLSLMWLSGKRNDDYYSERELLNMLSRQQDLNFSPGDEFLYSNSGYFLLSVLVERASGKSLSEFSQERIFTPLSMSNTHFHDDARRIVIGRAAGYAPSESGGWQIDQTTLPMVGDGGIFTTTRDLLRWDSNFYRNELGDQEMLATQLKTGRLTDNSAISYAAGLMVDEYRGLRIIHHGGAFVGFRAEMIRFPEHRTSVSVLCNLATSNPSRLARQVADVVLEENFNDGDGEDPATASAPTRSEAPRVSQYREPEGRVAEVTQEGESFQLTVPRVGTYPLERKAPGDPFDLPGAPYPTLIAFDKDGLRLFMPAAGVDWKFLQFKAIVLTPSLTESLVGGYFSEELATRYLLVQKDGNLYLKHEFEEVDLFPQPLFQPRADLLQTGSTEIQLLRDGDRVTGFRLRSGRVKNLLFLRELTQ